MGFITEFVSGLNIGFKELTEGLPLGQLSIINVFIFAILISLYSIFTWKFYRYLSKKDLIGLNLNQFNRTSHPALNKFFAVIFYLIEYIIILPFLIFFWFAVLAVIILALSENQDIDLVIKLSAAMVAAIRILSYYSEDLSKDLAKIFPFTVLTIFILNPDFFSIDRLVSNLANTPSLLENVIYVLVLIVALEFILRIIDTIMNFFKSEQQNEILKSAAD